MKDLVEKVKAHWNINADEIILATSAALGLAEVECPLCLGHGEAAELPCATCNGKGTLPPAQEESK